MEDRPGEDGQPAPDAQSGDTDIRQIHVVPPTISPTARTTLDLLRLPFPFSQVDLLTPSEFRKAAEQRRIGMWGGRDLDESGLQELHRRGVLVPFYCVSIADKPTGSPIDITENLTAEHMHGTIVHELYHAASDGRLTDPGAEPFTPWPTERVRTLWPSVERGYLYSYHQLLGLRHARSLVSALRPRQIARYQREWFLPDRDLPDEHASAGAASWRALAVALAALDTREWPYVTHLVGDIETWRAATARQNPEDLLDWLGVTVDQLRRQSERLRLNAAFEDVLGDFYDVVRRADSKAWDSLKGEARQAMDERMAAEALDRLADEVEGIESTARVAPPEPLDHQSLSLRAKSLDGALTDLRLSPHPSLVIALEGKTEMAIFPRVLEKIGVRVAPDRIRFVDFEGTLNMALLARYAVEPLLGEDHGEFVFVDRPVTRFLILADAENKFLKARGRAVLRKLLLDSITRSVPEDLRPDIYDPNSRIVEIMTWGRLPWEFAHFTDRQLAEGMVSVAGREHPTGRDALVAVIALARASKKPNIDSVWPRSGMKKVKLPLAEELWPILERRIDKANARGTKGPPMMRAGLLAYETITMPDYRMRAALPRRPGQAVRHAH